jgi:hypothetical protein
VARVKYNGRELDQNLQIEDGIRKTLRQSSRASICASVIDTAYELFDDDFYRVEGTLAEKCEVIAEIVGAQFSVAGDQVIFENTREC